MGSYNFCGAANLSTGENLLCNRDRRIAVSCMIQALRIFDHDHFRANQADAKTAKKQLFLARPPRKSGQRPWWSEDYSNARKIQDRELFA